MRLVGNVDGTTLTWSTNKLLGVRDCVIHGPKGNREAFLHARNAGLREPYSG